VPERLPCGAVTWQYRRLDAEQYTPAVRLSSSLWRATETSDEAVPGLTAYLSLLHRPVGRWLQISTFLDGLCLFGGAFPYLGAFVIQEPGLSLGTAGLLVTGFGLRSLAYTRAARHLGEPRLLLGGTGLAAGVVALAWAGHRPRRLSPRCKHSSA
jgi:DHA1 family inner membrane transport protein